MTGATKCQQLLKQSQQPAMHHYPPPPPPITSAPPFPFVQIPCPPHPVATVSNTIKQQIRHRWLLPNKRPPPRTARYTSQSCSSMMMYLQTAYTCRRSNPHAAALLYSPPCLPYNPTRLPTPNYSKKPHHTKKPFFGQIPKMWGFSQRWKNVVFMVGGGCARMEGWVLVGG